jgi:hypothetical protein
VLRDGTKKNLIEEAAGRGANNYEIVLSRFLYDAGNHIIRCCHLYF